MGARFYNPATGAFTSVFGGNTTAYAYPQDPINQFDFDGRKRFWKKKSFWGGVATAAAFGGCVFTGAIACVGMSLVATRINYSLSSKSRSARRSDDRKDVGVAAASGLTGGALGLGLRGVSRWHRGKVTTNLGVGTGSYGLGKCTRVKNRRNCR